MTRREAALIKIRVLESKLDVATDLEGARIEDEINSLQLRYGITLEEIRPPSSYKEMFPFLSEEVIKALEESKRKS